VTNNETLTRNYMKELCHRKVSV